MKCLTDIISGFTGNRLEKIHCMKSFQMRSFFWSVFSRILTEYGPEKNSVFGHCSRNECWYIKAQFEGRYMYSSACRFSEPMELKKYFISSIFRMRGGLF